MHFTMMQFAGGYLGLSYVVGAIWFLLLSAKEGFTKWRIIATTFSPLAVPLLLLAAIGIFILDKMIQRKTTATKKEEKKVVTIG